MKIGSKFSGRVAMVLGGLAVVAFVVVATNAVRDFRRDLTVYRNVPLAASRKEILYRLGQPKLVLDPVERDKWGLSRRTYAVGGPPGDQNTLPPDRDVSAFPGWVYDADDHGADLTVDFDSGGKVVEITCTDFGTNLFACGPFFGIWGHDTEDALLKKLGKPTSQTFGSGGTKTICFDDVGLCATLQKQKIYMFTKTAPKGGGWTLLRRFAENLT